MTKKRRYFLCAALGLLAMWQTMAQQLSLEQAKAKAESYDMTRSWLAQGESALVGGEEATDVSLSGKTYTIHTAKGLAWIAWVVQQKKTHVADATDYFPATADFAGCTVQLDQDIDLSRNGETAEMLWIPILTFAGHFDGQQHTVSGMQVSVDQTWVEPETEETVPFGLGLFGTLKGAAVKRLAVKGSISYKDNDKTYTFAGGIAGLVEGKTVSISDCATEVTIEICGTALVSSAVGGILGGTYAADETEVTLERCWSDCQLRMAEGAQVNRLFAGGIAGRLLRRTGGMTIRDCYSTGSLSGNVADCAMMGGLVGYLFVYQVALENNYSTAGITLHTEKAETESCVGGIIGYLRTMNDTSIANLLALNKAGIQVTNQDDTFIGSVSRIYGYMVNGSLSEPSGCYTSGLVTITVDGQVPPFKKECTPSGANGVAVSQAVVAGKAPWNGGETSAFTPLSTNLPQLKNVFMPTTTQAAADYFTEMPAQPIQVETLELGTITVSEGKLTATPGERVTFTIEAAQHYQVAAPQVTVGQDEIAVETEAAGSYSFEMPENAVTISAQFKSRYDWPSYGSEAVSGTDYIRNEQTYQILTARGLAWVAYVTNNDLTVANGADYPEMRGFKGCTVRLMEDIDLVNPDPQAMPTFDTNWVPIGDGSDVPDVEYEIRSFYGNFDGQWHTVKNLTISKGIYKGLFGSVLGQIDTPISIKQIRVEAKIISEDETYAIGALIATAEKIQLTHCVAHVAIEVNSIVPLFLNCAHTGGLVGIISQGSLAACWSEGTIENHDEEALVGGLVGFMDYQTCDDSYSTCDVTGYQAGGLVGYAQDGTLRRCYATGRVAGTDAAGGITGALDEYWWSSSIEQCLALNPSIHCEGEGIGRIGGSVAYSAELKDNYASTLTKLYKGEDRFAVDLADASNGADAYMEDLPKLFGANEAFLCSDELLPVLVMSGTGTEAVAMPGQPLLKTSQFLALRIPKTVEGEQTVIADQEQTLIQLGGEGKDVNVKLEDVTVSDKIVINNPSIGGTPVTTILTLAGQTTAPAIVVESGALTLQGTLPTETRIVVSRDAQLTDETGMVRAVYLSAEAEEPAIAITNQPHGGQLHPDGSRTLAMETTTQEDNTFSQLLYILQKWNEEEGRWEDQAAPQPLAQFEVNEVGTYRIRIEAWWSAAPEVPAMRSAATIGSSTDDGGSTEIGGSTDMAAADLVFYSREIRVQPYVPVCFYTVTLPDVTGARLNPSAGMYWVEEGDAFCFTLTLEEGYEASLLEVTTNWGDTLTADANGQYLITGIYQDIVVTISGIAWNPTANEQIAAGLSVSWQGQTLCIESATVLKSYHIYNVQGGLVATGSISGTSARIDGSAWPTGIYIVAIETGEGKRIVSKLYK